MNNLSSKLKKRIIIEEPVYTSDLLGGFITAWNNYKTLWAEVEPLKTAKKLAAEKRESRNNYNITTRYVAGITTKMRINLNGRYLQILSIINPNEENIMLEILATDEVQ